VAIESYAQVFAEENALDRLEAFTSLNGPKTLPLLPNTRDHHVGTQTTGPRRKIMKIEGPEDRALIHRGGEVIPGRLSRISVRKSINMTQSPSFP